MSVFSCNACGRGWSGLKECHCASSTGAVVTLWKSNPQMTAELDAVSFERPPHSGRVSSSKTAHNLSAVALPVERGERLRVVASMLSAVFLGRNQGQVAFTVVGFHVVDVMNMVVTSNSSRNDSMFIRFQIAVDSNLPAESNVSMATQVPAWFEVRNRLARGDRDYLGSTANLQTVPTEVLLRRAGNDGSAISTWLESGHAVIVTQWGCHESFSTEANFDRHRVFVVDGDWNARRCLSADELSALKTRSGAPVLVQAGRKGGSVWVGASGREFA